MFNKKTGQEPERVAFGNTSGSSAESTFSVLGPDMAIKGDVAASADLHVDGSVEGDIKCASLVQGESSEVRGCIAAESARLAGKVEGSVSAKDLVILKSARIHGDVHYDSLTIEQGALVDGKLSPRGSGRGANEKPGISAAGNVEELLIAADAAE